MLLDDAVRKGGLRANKKSHPQEYGRLDWICRLAGRLTSCFRSRRTQHKMPTKPMAALCWPPRMSVRRCWKPQFRWLSSDLNDEMAIAESIVWGIPANRGMIGGTLDGMSDDRRTSLPCPGITVSRFRPGRALIPRLWQRVRPPILPEVEITLQGKFGLNDVASRRVSD